jgi:sirohydrochlorin cobaltochelatase
MMPLMMVAGDHAHNDMAGDTGDSWKLMLKAQGYEVDYILKGMGELPAIRELFIEHAKEAIAEEDV